MTEANTPDLRLGYWPRRVSVYFIAVYMKNLNPSGEL